MSSARNINVFVRFVFLTIIVIFLFFKAIKTSKIKKVLKEFSFKDFDLFFKHFMKYQFDTDYIGLKNNEYNILFFSNHRNRINIEFEVIHKEQIKLHNKLVKYAKSKQYKMNSITYMHKTAYDEKLDAPVLQILCNLPQEEAIIVSKELFETVFNCNESSKFEILE